MIDERSVKQWHVPMLDPFNLQILYDHVWLLRRGKNRTKHPLASWNCCIGFHMVCRFPSTSLTSSLFLSTFWSNSLSRFRFSRIATLCFQNIPWEWSMIGEAEQWSIEGVSIPMRSKLGNVFVSHWAHSGSKKAKSLVQFSLISAGAFLVLNSKRSTLLGSLRYSDVDSNSIRYSFLMAKSLILLLRSITRHGPLYCSSSKYTNGGSRSKCAYIWITNYNELIDSFTNKTKTSSKENKSCSALTGWSAWVPAWEFDNKILLVTMHTPLGEPETSHDSLIFLLERPSSSDGTSVILCLSKTMGVNWHTSINEWWNKQSSYIP